MTEVLPSWAESASRARIIDFVERVSGDGDGAVPAAERVAVFDNDGTSWTEKPMPTQLHYIVQQWAAAAAADPALAERQPYAAAVKRRLRLVGGAVTKHYSGDDSDLKLMIGAILASRPV